MNPDKRDSKPLSPKDVADMFGVEVTTVARWTRENKLKCFRTPGGHRRFEWAAVMEFRNRQG